jgi:hypothetical protein
MARKKKYVKGASKKKPKKSMKENKTTEDMKLTKHPAA